MSDHLGTILSLDEITSLAKEIGDDIDAERTETAWDKLQTLRRAQRHQRDAASALLHVIDRADFPFEDAAEVVAEVADAHADDVDILASLGDCLEAARDIDDLNAPPPDEAVFGQVFDRLSAAVAEHTGKPEEPALRRGLAIAARMMARQHDDVAEENYRRLLDFDPKNSTSHYNLGLLYKTRGRFADGMKANQTAASLEDEPVEPYEWNLGICATGADNGELALDVWKRMDQIIEMGRFGLPDGRYPACKVKLAERPLAERNAGTDDPGLEETIWIERLSPCHGIIRSVLYQNLGVDYGDVVLIDGAPVTYHTYGDDQIPVFPHLATLYRQNYRFYDFAGTQGEARQLADVSEDLADDAVVYSHTENFEQLCASCWRDPDIDHEHHEAMEKHVVTGRIAAPSRIKPADLLRQIDDAVAARAPCQLYVPDLCIAAGNDDRAAIDRRRYDMLKAN